MEYIMNGEQFQTWYWWCKGHSTLLMVVWYSIGLAFPAAAFWLPKIHKIDKTIFVGLIGFDIVTEVWAVRHLTWYKAEAFMIGEVLPILITLGILNLLVIRARQGRPKRLPIKIGAYTLASLASVALVGSFVLVEVFPVLVCIYFSH